MKHLTFGSEKDKLRMVVENGVDASDPRVMTRTNEATQLLLGMRDPQTHEPIIPVNSMIFAAVQLIDGYFDLPPAMDAAYHVEQSNLDGHITPINGSTNFNQGDYNIINSFTYFDPNLAHDNPFIDYFLVPSRTDSTQLVRRYFYPGLTNERIFIIGPKAYLPITQDSDFLIVQNVPALKRMIQSVEYSENNQFDQAEKLYMIAQEIIVGEIKKHQMDPRNTMARRANYEADLVTFPQHSLGWTVARIALDMPDAQMMGRIELYRLVERAEMRAMWMGTWKGCLEEFNAEVVNGEVFLPARVESVLAVSLNGCPIQIRSIFFNYLDNGPGNWDCSCGGYVRDLGEHKIAGGMRRKFRVFSSSVSQSQKLNMVCKLRWMPKKPEEIMTVRCLDAIQLLCEWQLFRRAGQINEAREAQEEALTCLDGQLEEYLKGIKHTLPVNPDTVPLGMTGEYL